MCLACLYANACFRSLLPVPFHVGVAERCIAKQKHMVTASYISPAMRELHEKYAFRPHP